MIYFAEADNRIKIGTTRIDVHRRLKAISSSLHRPLKLIAQIEGGLELERSIQEQLKRFRLRGEWFKDCEEIRRDISNIVADPTKNVIPFVSKYRLAQKTFIPTEISPEHRRRALMQILEMMWPLEVLRQLSALSGEPEQVCKNWLNGESKMPRLVLYALRYLAMEWIHSDSETARSLIEIGDAA